METTEIKYLVYEYDFVLNKRLSEPIEFNHKQDAIQHALHVAAQWCEDEDPRVYNSQPWHSYDVYGDSDFGARITTARNWE